MRSITTCTLCNLNLKWCTMEALTWDLLIQNQQQITANQPYILMRRLKKNHSESNQLFSTDRNLSRLLAYQLTLSLLPNEAIPAMELMVTELSSNLKGTSWLTTLTTLTHLVPSIPKDISTCTAQNIKTTTTAQSINTLRTYLSTQSSVKLLKDRQGKSLRVRQLRLDQHGKHLDQSRALSKCWSLAHCRPSNQLDTASQAPNPARHLHLCDQLLAPGTEDLATFSLAKLSVLNVLFNRVNLAALTAA